MERSTTSPISVRSNSHRGFSLVEMLVVVGIIVVLLGISLPMLNHAYRASQRARVAANLQTLSIALAAYHADHGDYPRPAAGVACNGGALTPWASQLLASALVAPGPDSGGNGQDGAPGPGFRIRGTQGKVYGPYVQSDQFKFLPGATPFQNQFADPLHEDKPILYFPARLGGLKTTDIRAANQGLVAGTITASETALYNAAHNNLTLLNVADMRRMLGDTNPGDALISASDKPLTTDSFILWSAGPDGIFGNDDDVTSFK